MTNKTVFPFLLAGVLFAQQAEWLSVCSRCPAPTVFAKTGTGTSNSVAEARFSDADFRNECAAQGLKGPALAKCIADRKKEEGGKIYRASADCIAGKLKPIDEKEYAFAGVWPRGSMGEGRTRWRDVQTGQVVGDDNASGGLGLSQQWEVLCPGPLKIRPAATSARPALTAPGAAPAPAAPAAPPTPPVCNGAPQCTEVNAFAATVTDFRTSTSGSYRIVTATVRFQNKLQRPIILGYVSGGGLAIDDRGNRFAMNEGTGLRGLGFIRQNQVDPKFIIAPGQSSDARLEYSWYPRGGEIFGQTYDLEFTLREIVPVSQTQFRIGLEHPLRFRGLADSVAMSAAPAAPAAPAASAAAAPAGQIPNPAGATLAQPMVDHCAGAARCYSAGPFTAQITQITSSIASGYQTLRINMRFRNVTAQPLVLAYKQGSAIAIDNHGQRMTSAREPVVGMGTWGGGAVNADFQVAPGQHRDATFQVARYLARTLVGTGFTFDVAVHQLELLPANQVREVREYVLNFSDLTAANAPAGSMSSAPAGQTQNPADAVRSLRDLFNKNKKK
jgi:hypothetical protein